MSPISRGFRCHRPLADAARVPPGQHVVDEFPVLSVGATPHRPVEDEWTFQLSGAVDEPVSWTWEELLALPTEAPAVDIHCVTAWSKLDTTWRGVSVDTLLDGAETEAEDVSAWCDDGYRTNLPLEDVTGGQAWIAYEYGGEPLDPEYGGPARLLVPHPYFWKSANGSADSSSSSKTGRGSARPPATTTTVTRGRSRAMRATETQPLRAARGPR